MLYRWIIALFLAAPVALAATQATPQVPPHAPGSICFTPYFWCWVNPPGPPGFPCYCFDNWGNPIQGYLN